jgi:hypothetical protein
MVLFVLFGVRDRYWTVGVHSIVLLVLSFVHNAFGGNVDSDIHWADFCIPDDQAVQAAHRSVCGDHSKDHHGRFFTDILQPRKHFLPSHRDHIGFRCHSILIFVLNG